MSRRPPPAHPAEIPQARVPGHPTRSPRTRRHSAAHSGTPAKIETKTSLEQAKRRWRRLPARLAVGGQGQGRTADLPLSGERPGPRASTIVRLIRPDDLLGHLGGQDRLHVSTAVVSTALAAGLCIWWSPTFRLRAGSQACAFTPLVPPCSIRSRWRLLSSSQVAARAASAAASDLETIVRRRPPTSTAGAGDCHPLRHSGRPYMCGLLGRRSLTGPMSRRPASRCLPRP